MAQNVKQVYDNNPITSNQPTDLIYIGQEPYTTGDDAAIEFSDFAAQFASPITPAALTRANDTNVTLTLSGTPSTALLEATEITAGWSGQLAIGRGGTGDSSFTAYMPVCGGTTTTGALQSVSTSGAEEGYVLTYVSGSALPTWQSVSSEAVTTVDGDSGSATPSSGVLTISGGSTGLTTSASGSTVDITGTLNLASGGTNADLTASNGGIFYSTASAGAILSGTATAKQILQSGASTTPSWSTATYPSTTSVNQLLYSSSNNTVAGLTTMDSATLITSGAGAPSLSQTLPTAVQDNITAVGTIGAGTWEGSVVGSTYGGTGVDNGSSTITIGGNVAFSGGYTFTGTITGNTNLIFPTSGTLATTSGIITAVDGTSNEIGVSTTSGTATVSIVNNPILPGTGGVQIPSGSTLQRAGNAGTMRLNTSTSVFEGTVDGTNWATFESSAIGVISVSGTANQIDVSPTTGACVVSIDSAYVGQTSITTLGTIGTGTWEGTEIGLAYGGTNNNISAAAGAVAYSTASAIALTAAGTAGQILTSNGTSAPVWSGTVGPVWAANANSSISAAVNNGYILTSGSATTVTLPTTFAVGQQIGIQGEGAAWTLDIGASTNIKSFGNTYTTSLASTNNTDSVVLIGIVANTTWAILSLVSTGLTAS